MAAPTIRVLAAIFLVFAMVCVPIESGAAGASGVLHHSAAVSDSNALIAEVRVSLVGPASVFVEYDHPLAGRYRTRLGTAATEHAIPIVRLRPETTYDYTVFTVNRADESEPVRGPGGSFTTGALPKPLASVFTTAAGRSSQPLILSDYRIERRRNYFLFWDEVGALVWYLDVEHSGPVAPLPGREIYLFVPTSGGLKQFTPLGKVTDLAGDLLKKAHDDLVPLDGGRLILPVSNASGNFGSGDQRRRVLYDDLAIWHSATGRIDEVWSPREAWDILDPAQHWEPADGEGVVKWTHLNSVSVGERGNLLLSLGNRSQVVSLTPDYEIEWQLHGPESDYEFPDPTDRFYGQHTVSQLANGNILLFDNGRRRPDAEGGEYSRALELRLNEEAGTAVKVWEYRPKPDVYTPAAGSAYRLDSGNTLVSFGRRDEEYAQAPLVVVEADANGDEVFRVETVQLRGSLWRYRAYAGIQAIYGETMLRPPAAFVQHPPAVRLHYERMMRIAAATFDLYLDGNFLVYAKAPCVTEDVALPFFLHVYPKKRYVLADDQREAGFEERDFKFFQHGMRWQDRCHAEVPLPRFEIDRIATGQVAAEGGATAVRDGTNESPASAAWRVDVALAPAP